MSFNISGPSSDQKRKRPILRDVEANDHDDDAAAAAAAADDDDEAPTLSDLKNGTSCDPQEKRLRSLLWGPMH